MIKERGKGLSTPTERKACRNEPTGKKKDKRYSYQSSREAKRERLEREFCRDPRLRERSHMLCSEKKKRETTICPVITSWFSAEKGGRRAREKSFWSQRGRGAPVHRRTPATQEVRSPRSYWKEGNEKLCPPQGEKGVRKKKKRQPHSQQGKKGRVDSWITKEIKKGLETRAGMKKKGRRI